jgi:hypothetical protein
MFCTSMVHCRPQVNCRSSRSVVGADRMAMPRLLCCAVLFLCVLQAKQDMEQVKQMASGAVSKLSNMAGRFMNDLSRY